MLVQVMDITSHAPEFKDNIKTMDELYTEGDKCFLLSSEHYGEQAEIVSVDIRMKRVTVKLCVQQEPDLQPLIGMHIAHEERMRVDISEYTCMHIPHVYVQ